MALKPAALQWSGDGSLLSLDYGDIYFQRGQGIAESQYVFLEKNRVEERLRNFDSFRVAELGFGTGLNFLLTLKCFAATSAKRLFYASIEKHPIPKDDLRKILAHYALPQTDELLDQYPPMVEGFHHLHFLNGRARLMLLFGDVADVLPQLIGEFDAWYLDGFSPAKNPGMWNEKLYPLIAARTAGEGTLATFSSAGHVRRGLEGAGFRVEKVDGYGVKRDMTVATMQGKRKEYPRKQVAVIGAGIGGCAVAYALRQRGHSPVIYEKKTEGQRRAQPLAVLYPKLTADPSPMGSYHTHAFLYARGLVRHLQLPSWRECGVLHLDLDGDEKVRTQKLLASGEYPEDFIRAGEGGLFQPGAGMLDPVELSRLYLGDTPVHFGTGAPAQADTVVYAAGAATKQLIDWLPLQTVRGQMSLLKPTAASQGLNHVICHDGFLTPALNGHHGAGATFEKDSTFDAARPEDDAENIEKLNRHLPQFGFTADDIAGHSWGFRAATPDRLPMAGALPDYAACRDSFAALREGREVIAQPTPFIPGAYITTGFGAHGMSGAALSGEIVAAALSGEPCPVPSNLLEHLAPERFIFRGLKRKKL